MKTTRKLRYARVATGPLKDNKKHIFAATHALSIYQSEAIFSFIPKNASSTLRYSLALENGCIEGPEDIAWIHENNLTFMANLDEILSSKYTFVILRCPYSRLSSMFLDKIVGRKISVSEIREIYESSISFMHNLKVKFTPNSNHFRRLSKTNITFREFVDALCAPGALKVDVHWAPQSWFLVYEDYDDVFCLEKFDEVYKVLHDKISLNVVDADTLTNHGTNSYVKRTEKSFCDTPASELARMKEEGYVPSHSALYDNNIASKVANLYADDISLYEKYCGAERLLF